MSSAIYILDQDLNLLIQRQYRQDLDVDYILQSFKSIYERSNIINSPILINKDIVFAYLKKNDIIFMSPIFNNIDIMSHMTFLEKFSQLLIKYFLHYKLISNSNLNLNYLNSDLIKDNYILIYELFDECYDFGLPQLTDFNILKDYIKLMIKPEDYYDNSHFNEELNNFEKQIETEINSSISRTAMNKISWRPKGIFYNKNEFFINFNEFLKFKFNYKINKIINNQIQGEIQCKSYLSGMPNLKLCLNESLNIKNSIFNHIQYNQCVNLNSINKNLIEFIPPDGEFKLSSYEILNTSVLKPLILIKPIFRIFKKNNQFKLRLKLEIVTTFKRKFNMIDVKIKIPLIIKHKYLYINFNKSLKFKTKLGNVIHNLDNDSIIWKIEKIQGSMRGEMLAEFDLINEFDLFKKHLQNYEYGKQEKNDLFYFELGSEFSKLGNLKKTIIIENSIDNNNNNNNDNNNNNNNNKFNHLSKNDIMDSNIEKIVTIDFQLQHMLYSGLKVDYLSIKEDQLKLQTFPWIMYCVYAKDDDYSFILSDNEFINDLSPDDEKYLLENGKWTGKINQEDYDEGKELDDKFQNDQIQDNLDFSTALDHLGEIKITNKNDLDFEEYILDDENDENSKTRNN
jgi:hypothetical protein